jgi:hypothetical protein
MLNFAARNVPVMMDLQIVGPADGPEDNFGRITLRLPGGQEVMLTARLGGEDYGIDTSFPDGEAGTSAFGENTGERGIIMCAADQLRALLAAASIGASEDLDADEIDPDAIKFCAKCPTLIPIPHLAPSEDELCVACADVG